VVDELRDVLKTMEINPLVVSLEGAGVLALDASIEFLRP
jgi:succinyl-CoA synthetase beta subunit